jgi:NADH:ubiquinone oxidoreductase subunit 5 (subunit L)/multisubunit Na+/H+ antiporter MnhA subunit
MKLSVLSVIIAGIALVAMLFDGYFTTAEDFRNALWLAAADILGTVLGVILAIAAFAIVIWSYEKSLPLPSSSPPPSDEEIKHVISIADSHIGGEEE